MSDETVAMERLEFDYPAVALHCHTLLDAVKEYLVAGASKMARMSAALPREAEYTRTLPDYYAKLHSVTGLPSIFLTITAAVWAATDDIQRGLWAIDVVEAAVGCALDPVSVAAVEAGIACKGGDDIDISLCKQPVIDGVRLVAAVVFDTALTLTET